MYHPVFYPGQGQPPEKDLSAVFYPDLGPDTYRIGQYHLNGAEHFGQFRCKPALLPKGSAHNPDSFLLCPALPRPAVEISRGSPTDAAGFAGFQAS